MAGIGFILRKLVRRETLSGVVQGYFHGALASSGPWILTILAIASIYLLTHNLIHDTTISQFRTVILYNFCFALVLSSPFTTLVTRRLADCIYAKDLRDAVGVLLSALFFLLMTLFPVAMVLYFAIATLAVPLAILAVCNFLLIASVWLVMVYVSALKFYLAITYSFLAGLTVSVFGAALLSMDYGASGMLFGFNLGLILVLASILALIFVEYPRDCRLLFPFDFRKYWAVALSALFYNAGAWVDKWVMWSAPDAQGFDTGLPNYPIYDSSMFLAYLTIIPAMSLFVISQETAFFDVYLKFYRSIHNDENFNHIQNNHEQLLRSLVNSGRNLLLLQVFVCALALFASPKIFHILDLNYLGLAIFRIGVVGATFQVLTLFILIFLSYFDDRLGALKISILFFITNFGLSWLSRTAGLPYYGYGYFLSTLVTFVFAAVVIERYVHQLTYHAFIDNNSAVVE